MFERTLQLGLVGGVRDDVGQVREHAAHGAHDVEVGGAVGVERAVVVDGERRRVLQLGGSEAEVRDELRRPLPQLIVLVAPAPVAPRHYPPRC